MKNTLIIGNGTDYSEKKIKTIYKESDFIIVCDGGLNIADKLNIKPDLILGDFDSVDRKLLLKYINIKQEKYPVEKDLTDSELALQKALHLKTDVITMVSMTGSYFDHSIANVINLLRNQKKDIKMELITSNSTIFLIDKYYKFTGYNDRRISFFPLSKIENLEMKGFKYIFDKTKLDVSDYSVSNVIIQENAEISFRKGFMICILFDLNYI